MNFTDSHCHLDFPELSTELSLLLTNCIAENIHRIIIPSIAPNNWQQILNLCVDNSQLPCQLLPALGIHPWLLNELTDTDLTALTQLVNTTLANEFPSIVAIGETGIDGAIAEKENNLNKQQHFFDYQLMLAKEKNLPVIVHHRKSHHHIIPMLKQAKLACAGVIHAFSGSYQEAKQYIELGFKLGIGGTITYPRAKKTIDTVKKLPLESLLLETDAPAMPLQGFQGKANSPIQIKAVFNCLTELRAEPADVIAEQIEQNINTLFHHSKTMATVTTKTSG